MAKSKVMKIYLNHILLILFLFLQNNLLFCQEDHDRNYIATGLASSNFRLDSAGLSMWRQEKRKSILQKMDALPDSVKTNLKAAANKALGYNWPALPASIYLEYKLNGNRIHYEDKLNERRKTLDRLVLGALVCNDKRYLIQIINGIWATLEESTWVLPAHLGMQQSGIGLPDPSEEIIDLFSAETAASIAAIQLLFYDDLQHFSPLINKRIDFELNKRIVKPYLARKDFWWMGFAQKNVNNWNPWINCNVLNTILYTAQSTETLKGMVQKLGNSIDFFINGYGADGGCDEGPTYWAEAGGKLIRFLCLLQSVSDGKLLWKKEALLHRIGSYIYNMHIGGAYFVNFADALPVNIPNPETVFQFGKYFDDDTLLHLASYLFKLQHTSLANAKVNDFIETVNIWDELNNTSTQLPSLEAVWMPQVEVMVAQAEKNANKLLLAAQAGNNGESHNHNDVGNFIIYANGTPVIVDAGVGTYTAKTFSKDRYSLWNLQSQWHNCPGINGVDQMDGKQYAARELQYANNGKRTSLSMDISGAYPANAFVKKWTRSFVFDRVKNQIQLTDKYELEKWKDSTRIHFLCYTKPVETKAGRLDFFDMEGRPVLYLEYDNNVKIATIEKKEMDEERLKNSWKQGLYRVSFVVKHSTLNGAVNFIFETVDVKGKNKP